MSEEKKATIILGEKIDLELFIVNEENLRPKDLTDFDEIIFCVDKADGSILEKKLSDAEIVVTNEVLGELKVLLLAADTALLKVGDNQSFDVHIANSTSGEDRTVKFKRLLNVEEATCS